MIRVLMEEPEEEKESIHHRFINQQPRQLNKAEIHAAEIYVEQRLAEVEKFIAMIVHEIRNPLATVVLGLKYCQKQLKDEPAQERLALSISEADRLDRLLNELILCMQPQALQFEELELNDWLQTSLHSIVDLPEVQGRQINFTPVSDEIRIWGNRDKLKQVIINIIRNACEASRIGGDINCKVELLETTVCIRICNQGQPIPPDVLAKLGQPFFSTKPEGTGLGLAIVNCILKDHRGKLLIQSNDTETSVSVYLPTISALCHTDGS